MRNIRGNHMYKWQNEKIFAVIICTSGKMKKGNFVKMREIIFEILIGIIVNRMTKKELKIFYWSYTLDICFEMNDIK